MTRGEAVEAFLELLNTELDAKGKDLAEAMAPAIIEAVGAIADTWFNDVATSISFSEWDDRFRSAIVSQTIKHLRGELAKVESMHDDLIFATLERTYEEGDDGT